MSANAQVYSTTTVTNASIATTAETIVATLTSVNINVFGANIRFLIDVGLTPSADATAVVLRVRRDSVTGTTVVPATSIPITAAIASQLPLIGAANEPVGQRTYVVTAVVTGASSTTAVSNVGVVAVVGN